MTAAVVATMEETQGSSPAKQATSAPATGWAATTYFAEGLPYSLVHQMGAQQYLTAVGASPEMVGLGSLLHVPWLLKFVWAPVVDGRSTAKRWLVGAGLVLAGCAALMSFASFQYGAIGVVSVLIATAFVAATSDIAIDGYYIRSLDKDRQVKLSGLRIGAFRMAMLFGSGALVTLAGLTSFSLAFLVAGGVLVALALLHAAWLTPDSRAFATNEAPDAWRTGREALRGFLARPGITLSICLIMTYRAGDALLFAMNAKFLKALGLDTAARGIVNGSFGTAASILGSLLGAWVIAKLGFKRAFFPITVLQALALLLYVGLANGEPGFMTIAVVVVLEQLIAGIGTAAFTVFLLRLCHGPQKASHFALASSLMAIAVTVSGSVSGFLYVAVGASWFFAIAFFAALPGVLLSLLVDKD